mmetsp:Transcript_8000/g.19120  ORF Transcript_8000/g.19120 Transcript_8000/m.19120 type:complete len:131 (-) Transcript_8000:211-603(-)
MAPALESPPAPSDRLARCGMERHRLPFAGGSGTLRSPLHSGAKGVEDCSGHVAGGASSPPFLPRPPLHEIFGPILSLRPLARPSPPLLFPANSREALRWALQSGSSRPRVRPSPQPRPSFVPPVCSHSVC